MSGLDNLTTQDLVDRALQSRYTTGEDAHQMIAALAKRLKAHHHRVAALEQRANTNRPGPGYVLVGKPHVSKCSIGWRCVGPGQTTQFGVTPRQAYQCWAQMIARRPYHPRRHFMPVEP